MLQIMAFPPPETLLLNISQNNTEYKLFSKILFLPKVIFLILQNLALPQEHLNIQT